MSDTRMPSGSASRPRRTHAAMVGDFCVDSEIGKGSFAKVYLGFHKESKAAVAIKSVDVEKLSKKLKENLYSEIEILKTLRHPHIVALHDCVESPSHIHLVMEYCELGDLSLFIKKKDKLVTHPATHEMARKYPSTGIAGLHEVVIRHFLKQLASALEFLRRRNYVHRDVKPQNLLLLPSPEYRQSNSRPILTTSHDSLTPVVGLSSLPMLKLADFGFARVLPSTSLAETLCGSPLYMAPEILRYEPYDAKADLWSVGTVLYEMSTGRPPTRARNHVELLKKIEMAADAIKFPKDAMLSADLKALIRSLLRRVPAERLSFENFFAHTVVTSPIPGLVEDDLPPAPVERRPSLGSRPSPLQNQELQTRRYSRHGDAGELAGPSRSPKDRGLRSPKVGSPVDRPGRPSLDTTGRQTYSPSHETHEGLGIRPRPHSAATAPVRPHKLSDASSRSPTTATRDHAERRPASTLNRRMTEEEKAAQDVADMREYVVIEKKHVEINALADEFAAGGRAEHAAGTAQAARHAQASTGKELSTTPGSATHAIAKALTDAGIRLFGPKYLPGAARGHSPPSYKFFPAYTGSSTPAGLISDGRPTLSGDDDRAAQTIEDCASRSDVVFGFAEVKFKQLFPSTPSTDHGLVAYADPCASEEDGLTADAVVVLSEEAFVLYYKALTLLARAMDIANMWWTRKRAADGGSSSSPSSSSSVVSRVNSVVQWARVRFNEVLEKTEMVHQKLVEGQKRLPEDHPGHPGNRGEDASASSGGGGFKPVHLTPGITAEKLMYDRAIEMSRQAAISEISNENLTGCQLSYETAVRMLEVVLDSDSDSQRKRVSAGARDSAADGGDNLSQELDNDDKATVRKMIAMINGRLELTRRKMKEIADAERTYQQMARRRSGDVTPRSVPSHTSS